MEQLIDAFLNHLTVEVGCVNTGPPIAPTSPSLLILHRHGVDRLPGGAGWSTEGQDVQTGPCQAGDDTEDRGSQRPLGIPTIRDRVAQMAMKLVIEPIFEADFCDTSYGFRPRKSAHDAVDDVWHTMNRGYTEVIDADLSKYFDTIPHSNLMATVAQRISDGEILRLIQMWLKAPVVEVDKEERSAISAAAKATAKVRPKAVWSHRCWPISTCIFWIGYGNGGSYSNG